MIREREIKE